MIPKTFEDAFAQVKGLASRFGENEAAYLSPKYQEAEVRQDFLDKFFVALGWDVYHQEHPNPYEREVKIEKSVMVGDRGKRADYAFYTRPNFLQARFMAEAKKPARQLENPYDCFQAMRYGWNSNTPLAVLTDFEQFLILDSRYKPTVEKAANGIIEKFHYSQFLDEESFRKIYYLFSREAVGDGSLEKFIQGLKKAKTAKAAKVAPSVQIQPVGDTFLTELDVHRDELARGFKRNNAELDGDELTEITQRTLDRLVFIRFLEDKLVEPSEIIDRLGVKSGSKWRDFANEVPRLNSVYNGIIFKPHAILDSPNFQPDEKAFADTLAWLSHKNSPYDFNTIPIHILGSIYERFLGKTIVVTDKRAKLEEKPEVRKAGGVYYTPEYIVRYIVENTIGALLQKPARSKGVSMADEDALTIVRASATAATPDEIAKMRFADIACGSGSFLLGIFDYLIKYHVEWYNANKSRRSDAIKQGLCRETSEGNLQLTIPHKRDILLNNIYGVDLDAQAVEVAQLSLYLKLLEEETTATAQQYLAGFREQLLPSLNNNIVHGNSLIDFDIMDEPLFAAGRNASVNERADDPHARSLTVAFPPADLRKLNPMSFQSTFPEVFANGGFDAIVGNPPYVRHETISELKPYLQKKYDTFHGMADLYVYFLERYIQLLKEGGEFGIIVANKWLRANYGQPLRAYLKKREIVEIVDFGDLPVFQGATTYPCIIRVRKNDADAQFRVTEIVGLDFGGQSMSEYVLENQFSVRQEELDDKGWSLTDNLSQDLMIKLCRKSVSLQEYSGNKIYCGVKTGFNEAFIIDDATRRSLISEDANSAVLIKPYLMGREVKRYDSPTANKFIIFTRRGVNINDFPAIKRHLSQYKTRLTPKPKDWNQDKWNGRKPGSYQWYEIQDTVEYFAEFERDKIIYAEIANRGQFCIDYSKSYVDMTSFVFSSSDKYLLGLLNSTLITFAFSKISSQIRGGYLRWKSIYVNQLPIRTIDFNNPAEKAMHDRMVELVEKMIDGKKKLAEARTDSDRAFYERLCTSLDTQIDNLVYQLYDITPEERKIIEDA